VSKFEQISDAEGRAATHIGGDGVLYKPPSVRVEWRKAAGGMRPWLVYPTPTHWPKTINSYFRKDRNLDPDGDPLDFMTAIQELTPLQLHPFESIDYDDMDVLPEYGIEDLLKCGWEKRSFEERRARGAWLLNDFVKLAGNSAKKSEDTADHRIVWDPTGAPPIKKETRFDIRKVAEFVLKWGPLWACRSHVNCIFTSGKLGDNRLPCFWAPREDPYLIEYLASQFSALNEIALALRIYKPGKSWSAIFPEDVVISKWPIPKQRRLFASLVNLNLSPCGPGLVLQWEKDVANLRFSTGLGFYRLAWIQLAQSVSEAVLLYTCSGCDRPYLRDRRSTRERNFCSHCGKGASKREWARRNRGKVLSRNGN
jgi:hypothetical protein